MTPTAQLDGPLRALLQRGQPTPQEVADLMRRYPMQRIAMMQTLQRTLGNSFAGQVTALVQGIDGPVAATSSRVPVPPELSSMKPAVDGAAIEQNATKMADAAQGAIDNARALLPPYTRARNALDKAAIEEIGGTLLATLELVRVANGGTKSQLSKYVAPTQSLPGGDPMAETSPRPARRHRRSRRSKISCRPAPSSSRPAAQTATATSSTPTRRQARIASRSAPRARSPGNRRPRAGTTPSRPVQR